MGNTVSSTLSRRDNKRICDQMSNLNDQGDSVEEDKFYDTSSDDKSSDMEEFKKQLNVKREQRREILDRLKSKKESLEKALDEEKKSRMNLQEENRFLQDLLIKNNIEIPENFQKKDIYTDFIENVNELKEELNAIKDNNHKLRTSLAESNSSLQGAYSEIADLHEQNTESIKQISALKEVISVSKTMLGLREQQLLDLKNKLNEIEQSLTDREASMLSSDLRQEYERQLQNIRTLRGLYEERARLAEVTRQNLVRELEEQKSKTQVEVQKCVDLTANIEELQKEIENLNDIIASKTEEISVTQKESNGLKTEMLTVNKLFSQILLGYKKKQDLDKLISRLEENHGILSHLAVKEIDLEAASALPKLLLELINQTDDEESKNKSTDNNDTELKETCDLKEDNEIDFVSRTDIGVAAEEIVKNLPKVWKVLIELLSHQSTSDSENVEKVTTCYKTVETSSGPVLVPSVSQTYIRLKDLIIEKLALLREVNRMKQLNNHLGSRLEEQEQRLCLVTKELSKTWHVVGRLRRHHHQLHTHEKILKYELQQKRKLLNELKEELEYCREKWEQAREKNTQSEKDWKKLRTEFSNRKLKVTSPSLTNSAESGYSDERPSDSSDSNDESEYVAEPLIKSRRKSKTSLDTAIDSSTDFNLAAEREEPVSDMIDVTDLPLDILEGDDNPETSRSISLNCPKTNDETEDEACDIMNEPSSVQISSDQSIGAAIENITQNINKPIKEVEIVTDDPTGICEPCSLEPVNCSEKPGSSTNIHGLYETAKPTLHTQESNNEFNTSLSCYNIDTGHPNEGLRDNKQLVTNDPNRSNISVKEREISETINAVIEMKSENNGNVSSEEDILPSTSSTDSNKEIQKNNLSSHVPDINLNSILESIRAQNERLAKKDERLQNLENGCNTVVKSITSTLNTGNELVQKLDLLHDGYKPVKDESENSAEDDEHKRCSPVNELDQEPSTSNDIDHEIRFAERDRRLKRLEEQTKSLVNKVNNTTTKGVKIHYKLEELHNIYGSETSRDGTPAEDSEGSVQTEEDDPK